MLRNFVVYCFFLLSCLSGLWGYLCYVGDNEGLGLDLGRMVIFLAFSFYIIVIGISLDYVNFY